MRNPIAFEGRWQRYSIDVGAWVALFACLACSGATTQPGSKAGGSANDKTGGTTSIVSAGGATTGGAGTIVSTAGGSTSGGTRNGGAAIIGGATMGGSILGGQTGNISDAGVGGFRSGGVVIGGSSTGGAVPGGIRSGGTGPGGASGGGIRPGGANTGGTGTGGAGQGGANSGGSTSDLCNVGVWDGSTKPTPLVLAGNRFAHDPTVIAAHGTYYRFWTGNNIPSARSTNLTNWQNAPSVFTNGYSPWVGEWLKGVSDPTFNFPWAPDVSYFNGKYHIYSSFSAKFGDNISCITHLSTSDIAAGNWVDHGPVICTTGSENYNAIDADVGLDATGTPWLAFGSFWNGIMAFQLNPEGSRVGTNLTRLAWAPEIEAPVLFYRCGYYYLFVTWGLCCPGEGRSIDQLTYRVVVGRSQAILGPYVDRNGKAMLDGGGTLMVQGDHVTWAAAGHSDVLVAGDKIYHHYHAYQQSNGSAQWRIVEMPFDNAGWPVPAGP